MNQSTHSQSENQLPLVVIGHQSAIPHYRVAFYQKLKEISAGRWNFGVLFDPEQQARDKNFSEELNANAFGFQTFSTPVKVWHIGSRRFVWQNMKRHLESASLLITDSQVSNLSYPWYALTRNSNCRWAIWGHTKNRNLTAEQQGKLTAKIAAKAKGFYLNKADAFFVYTNGERSDLLEHGYPAESIHVIDNTIDIERQRAIYLEQLPARESIRRDLNFADSDFVFIMIGRLLPGRRVEFLIEAFEKLYRRNQNIKLVVIGSGSLGDSLQDNSGITYLGSISDEDKIGSYLTAADAYIAPGMLGLGMLQPLAHELPIIAFDLETHGPEIEYLNKDNSDLLSGDTTPDDLVCYIKKLYKERPPRQDESRYRSVAHLTLDNMVEKFDSAVSKTLKLS